VKRLRSCKVAGLLHSSSLTRNYPNSHNFPSRLWSQLKAHCIERGDDQAVIVFVPQFDRANLFGQPPSDLGPHHRGELAKPFRE
jgi:hypothetical protein